MHSHERSTKVYSLVVCPTVHCIQYNMMQCDVQVSVLCDAPNVWNSKVNDISNASSLLTFCVKQKIHFYWHYTCDECSDTHASVLTLVDVIVAIWGWIVVICNFRTLHIELWVWKWSIYSTQCMNIIRLVSPLYVFRIKMRLFNNLPVCRFLCMHFDTLLVLYMSFLLRFCGGFLKQFYDNIRPFDTFLHCVLCC